MSNFKSFKDTLKNISIDEAIVDPKTGKPETRIINYLKGDTATTIVTWRTYSNLYELLDATEEDLLSITGLAEPSVKKILSLRELARDMAKQQFATNNGNKNGHKYQEVGQIHLQDEESKKRFLQLQGEKDKERKRIAAQTFNQTPIPSMTEHHLPGAVRDSVDY